MIEYKKLYTIELCNFDKDESFIHLICALFVLLAFLRTFVVSSPLELEPRSRHRLQVTEISEIARDWIGRCEPFPSQLNGMNRESYSWITNDDL